VLSRSLVFRLTVGEALSFFLSSCSFGFRFLGCCLTYLLVYLPVLCHPNFICGAAFNWVVPGFCFYCCSVVLLFLTLRLLGLVDRIVPVAEPTWFLPVNLAKDLGFGGKPRVPLLFV
jgi:hypothetical protein